MKRIDKKKTFALILVMVYWSLSDYSVISKTSSQGESSFRIVWDKRYGDERLWNEYRAMAVGTNGETWIAASGRNLPGTQPNVNRLFLWRIDLKGEIASETEIKKPYEASRNLAKEYLAAAIKDLVVLGNGDALLVVDFESSSPSIVRVNRLGKQELTKNLISSGRQIVVVKIVPSSDGKFLLLGHESLNALAMKIDATGNVLWERKIDQGKMELFVDGIATENGGFILVGNSGQYDPLRSGPSTVWVSQYNANGQEEGKISFPGRYGRVAQSQDRSYGVVYDKGASNGQDIRLKALSSDLKEFWEFPVLSVEPNFVDFRIAATPGGGFVIAGGKAGRLYLARVNAKGQNVGAFQSQENTSIDIGYYGLILRGSELLVAFSTIQTGDKANVKRQVRMMRII